MTRGLWEQTRVEGLIRHALKETKAKRYESAIEYLERSRNLLLVLDRRLPLDLPNIQSQEATRVPFDQPQ